MPASENGINSRAKCFSTATKRKLSSGILSSDTVIHGGKSPEKSKQSFWKNTTQPEYLKLNVKAEPHDSAVPFDSPQFPRVVSGMSKLKCRNQSPDRKEIVGNKKPKIEKVVKEEIVAGSEAAEERKMEKVSKKKLVIGYGAVKTASHNQDLRLDCSPFPRKEGSMSKTKSKNRSPDRQDIVGNLKPKIEKVTSVVAVVGSEASKNLDIAQSSNYMRDRIPGTSAAALKKRKTEGFENVGIEIHAASEVRKSDDVHTNRRDVVAQAPSRTKPQSANESGKAVRALIKCYRKAFSSQYQGYKILQEQCFGLKVWKWERNIVETGQVIALFLFVLSRTPQNLNKPKRLGAPLCPRNGFRSATSKENLLRSKGMVHSHEYIRSTKNSALGHLYVQVKFYQLLTFRWLIKSICSLTAF